MWSSASLHVLTKKETHFDMSETAANGSSAQMIDKSCSSLCWSKSTQERVRLLLDFCRLDFLRRNYGETMRHWTRRFTLQYSKVGQAPNTSNSEVSKDFLHENIQGISLAETQV